MCISNAPISINNAKVLSIFPSGWSLSLPLFSFFKEAGIIVTHLLFLLLYIHLGTYRSTYVVSTLNVIVISTYLVIVFLVYTYTGIRQCKFLLIVLRLYILSTVPSYFSFSIKDLVPFYVCPNCALYCQPLGQPNKLYVGEN